MYRAIQGALVALFFVLTLSSCTTTMVCTTGSRNDLDASPTKTVSPSTSIKVPVAP